MTQEGDGQSGTGSAHDGCGDGAPAAGGRDQKQAATNERCDDRAPRGGEVDGGPENRQRTRRERTNDPCSSDDGYAEAQGNAEADEDAEGVPVADRKAQPRFRIRKADREPRLGEQIREESTGERDQRGDDDAEREPVGASPGVAVRCSEDSENEQARVQRNAVELGERAFRARRPEHRCERPQPEEAEQGRSGQCCAGRCPLRQEPEGKPDDHDRPDAGGKKRSGRQPVTAVRLGHRNDDGRDNDHCRQPRKRRASDRPARWETVRSSFQPTNKTARHWSLQYRCVSPLALLTFTKQMRTQLTRIGLAVFCAATVASALAAFAHAAPPAASQYVEHIPTASGMTAVVAPASAGQPATAQGTAGTATSPTSTTSTSNAGHSAHPAGKPLSQQRAADPLRAAVATGDGKSGLGRGALFAIVLAAITFAAFVGLMLRRRLAR